MNVPKKGNPHLNSGSWANTNVAIRLSKRTYQELEKVLHKAGIENAFRTRTAGGADRPEPVWGIVLKPIHTSGPVTHEPVIHFYPPV
jgi:hypothetical protein